MRSIENVNWHMAGGVGALMALCGGAVGIAMVAEFRGLITHHIGIVPFVIAAMFGAGIAGAICSGMFGHRGARGVFMAICGAIFATVLGGALAGLVALPAQDFRLFGLGIFFAAITWIVLAWGAIMALVHIAAKRLRSRQINVATL